jgi:hypothetical protein
MRADAAVWLNLSTYTGDTPGVSGGTTRNGAPLDIFDNITGLAARIKSLRDSVRTEEAVKTAFILPFIQALGYDVFNPLEVVPEHIADHGVKKGEKVDYAIRVGGELMMLLECKQLGAPLESKHAGQLFRYFAVSNARFGILADGARYLFYTDIAAPNLMDAEPFFEFNVLDFTAADVDELKRFTKSLFDVGTIQSAARDRRCLAALATELQAEFANPSEDLTRLFFTRIMPGARFTGQAKEQFAAQTRKAMASFLAASSAAPAPLANSLTSHESIGLDRSAAIVTTPEELAAFHIVQAIGAERVLPEDIVLRDAKSYCAILYQDNNRKPLARLYFNRESNMQVGFFTEQGEVRQQIAKVQDLYQHKALILARLSYYQSGAPEPMGSYPDEPAVQVSAPSMMPAAPVRVAAPVAPPAPRFGPTILGRT